MDSNTFTDRLKRHTKITGQLGAIAAQYIGARVTGNDDAFIAALGHSLGQLKGPIMKIAQMLATIPDAIPKEYADALRTLQSNAPPMGPLFVKRRMASELGPSWAEYFDYFDVEPFAAASLGQVHRGTISGQHVVCKLQYPNMEATVTADLQQAKVLFGLYEAVSRGILTDNIYTELHERLMEELDYKREAAHINLFQNLFATEPTTHIPHVLPDLSTHRLLTMSFMNGASIMDFCDASQDVRNTIAMRLFRTWYIPFYTAGVIHGDPHLGNYKIDQDMVIQLLDFGCVRFFSSSFIQGVMNLCHALATNDDDLAVHAYGQWGFHHLNKETIDVLNMWARFLYGPLLVDKVTTLEDNGMIGRDLARKVHDELRRIGGVEPPREFVLMDRAAVGLGSALIHLRAKLNWHQLHNDLIRLFDAERIEQYYGQKY